MGDIGFIPYGRQAVSEDDIKAVAEVLRSDFLTTGPAVEAFESGVAGFVGARHAVAVNSGTAALHCAMHSLGIGPGDEVVVPPVTFAATSNAVLYCGATPVFADVDPGTLLIDPQAVERAVTSRTRAVVGVDYAGQPCDWDALRSVADRHGLALVADGCHALGASDKGRPVGTLADVTCFSFHPVKHVTTGEGGMAVTGDEALARSMRIFRSHGIEADYKTREARGTWFYEMTELGFNYRITDIQCALGLSQLGRQKDWLKRRRDIARHYGEAFAGLPEVAPLALRPEAEHAYHLYVVRIPFGKDVLSRQDFFAAMRAERIGVQVHYVPVHLHPYYHKSLGTGPGLCPVAEKAYEEIVSLPMFPSLDDDGQQRVIHAVKKALDRS